MLKVLSARLHGVLDYVIALAFIVAPAALELAYPAEALAYITGSIYLGVVLFSRYPLGMLELIPYPIHGLIEAVLAACWIGMPWLLSSPIMRLRATSTSAPARRSSSSCCSRTTAQRAPASGITRSAVTRSSTGATTLRPERRSRALGGEGRRARAWRTRATPAIRADQQGRVTARRQDHVAT